MEVEWRFDGHSWDLFRGWEYQGTLSAYPPEYWWHNNPYNSPHAVTKFTSSTLDEAKQIAQAIWAIQKSAGVKQWHFQ
jgi:hypothetical protein